MKTSLLTALLVVGFASSAAALPSPQQLNLTIPLCSAQKPVVAQTPKPLLLGYRRAEIEAMAVEAVRNGVESGFTRALIRQLIIGSPTRTYKYAEVDRLVDTIYTKAKIDAGGNSVIVRGLK